MKKIIAIILCVCLIVSVCSITAFAADATTGAKNSFVINPVGLLQKVYFYATDSEGVQLNGDFPGTEVKPIGVDSYGDDVFYVEYPENTAYVIISDGIVSDNGGHRTEVIDVNNIATDHLRVNGIMNDQGHYLVEDILYTVIIPEPEKQKVYFEYPDSWSREGLTIDEYTHLANVYCYAYPIYGNKTDYSMKWQTKSTRCVCEDYDGEQKLFSYDLAQNGTIEDGADYGIVFSTTAGNGYMTVDLTMTSDCIVDTACVTPYNGMITRQSSAEPKDFYAAWKNTESCGPMATITSLGTAEPGVFPVNKPKAQNLSDAFAKYLANPVNNQFFRYDNNMLLCEALEVTPKQVYDQYMTDYSGYFTGASETADGIPCPFYRYTYEDDLGQPAEGKLAAPEYVREVLGLGSEKPKDVYSIVGSSTAIFGTAYNLNDESTVMTFDPDDGLYKYTFTDVQPEKHVTFTVVKNHKWYDEYPVFNSETVNIISSGDILVTFDAKTTKIELSGDGIQTAIEVENAIAVGNGSENYLNNENWNPTAEKNSMTEVSEGVWEYTCSNVPAGEDYQIKACFNSIGNDNPYEYNFGAVDDNKVELGAELTASFNGRPCHFDVAEDGSTVTYRLDISNFNFYTKQGAKFSITVTPPEDVYTVQVVNTGFYPYPEEVPMTYDGEGLYVLAVENVEPQNTYIYVWKNHTEKYGDPDAGNGYPYEINVVETCDVLITFDPETGIINAVGDGVMPPLDLYIDSVIVAGNGEGNYLNGANWDPADTSNSMTEVDDGIWELTMENIDAYDNYNFKFAVDSVDEYGNPTTEPWRYSFGAEFEQFYPTGIDLDAVYGGKNIIFEAEEDSSTVIIRLDLRDFDFQTKKGAKFSVTIPAPEGNRYEDAFKNWSVTKYGEECLDYGYSYNELYTHNDGDQPDWVLCQAKYGDYSSPMITWLRLGGIGGRTVINPNWGSPFMTGYGVYDVEANEFYALEDLTDDRFMPKHTGLSADKYDGLIDALAELNIGYATGDANKDNKIDILDAAFIQKAASGKADIGYMDRHIADVNGDKVVDILDATAIQKYAAA